MYGFISYNQYKKELALNETYESYAELSTLAHDIITRYSIGSSFAKDKFHYIKDVYRNHDLFKDDISDINNFKVIKNFVNEKIGIIYSDKVLKIGGGIFMTPVDYKEYLERIFDIVDVEELTEKFPVGILAIGTRESEYLLHELQHAYDNYRSGGKLTTGKNMEKYDVKVRQLLDNIISREDIAPFYFRSQPELSSYFVQAMHSLNLLDWQKHSLRNINDLYSDFKRKFHGYEYLTPKIKKMLARKFSQYYHKIKEEQTV